MLKIFISLLRDRMFEFLHNNKYIETWKQKGTLEHIANMSCIINDARRRQRSVTIKLIDLQNAFGEVYHNLIESVLKYTRKKFFKQFGCQFLKHFIPRHCLWNHVHGVT